MDELGKSWALAANRLGIQVSAPYQAELEDTTSIIASALVHDFGASKGTLIFSAPFSTPHSTLLESGFAFSILSEPSPDEEFDIVTFIEVLKDWGWANISKPAPSWFNEA